jgi:integrase/recombinase XerD
MATTIQLIPSFEANLKRKGRKKSTIDLYHWPLSLFAEWAGERDVDEFQPLDMERYFDHFEVVYAERNPGKEPATNTRRKHFQALSLFFEWAIRYDHIAKSPMRQMDAPPVFRKANDWLRPDEDKALLDACLTPDEFLAVFLLRFTGLRASEAVALRWSDVEWGDGRLWVVVRESKTARGRRRVPVPGELRPFLMRSGPVNQVDAPIFMTRTGKAWHRNQLYSTVKRVGDRAGLHVYPHRLRKTLGSSVFNAGADLSTISRILGHSSTQITEQAYAELTTTKIADDFLRAMG